MKVAHIGSVIPKKCMAHIGLGGLYRKARRSGWNMFKRRLHTLEIPPQQLAHIPPNPTRYPKARYRSRRCQAQPKTDDGGKKHLGGRSDERGRVLI